MAFPNTSFIDGQTVIEADWLNAVNEKCLQSVSVDDYGADPTGVQDSTAAIQAAFDYAAVIGSGLVVGQQGAIYKCGQINAVCGVSFDGSNCDIISTAASWLLFTGGPSFKNSTVSNVRVRATLAPTLGSIGIGFEGTALGSRRSITIDNIVFYSNDNKTISDFGYERYINLSNASYPQVLNVKIDGCFNPTKSGPGPNGQFVSTGVYLDNQTVGAYISHCRFGTLYTGVRAPTYRQEGIQIFACEAVGVRDGYDFSHIAPLGGPGIWLVNCHANATRTAFNVSYRTDISLVGCSSYKGNTLYSEDWVGVDFTGIYSAKVSCHEVLYNDLTYAGSKGFKLLSSLGVTGSSLTFRQPKIALSHEGGCIGCSYDAVTFFGSGTYADTAFATKTSDSGIQLQNHNLLSVWNTPYVIATPNTQINVKRAVNSYSNISDSTITEAGTKTLVVNATSSPQMQRIGLAVGSGPYDYVIELSTENALKGDYWNFYFNLPSAADRRILVKNGVGGSTITTLATASSKRYGAQYVFNGVQWLANWINESVFM